MKDPYALPTLERVLRDLKEDPMVRHEAAEAMGAISSVQSIPRLNEFLNDQRREVWETCEIALAKVEWDNSAEGKIEMTKSQEENPLVYQYAVSCGLLFYFIYLFCKQFTSEEPAPRRAFDRHPLRAHLTQTPTFRLLLQPSSIRLFPCSSDPRPSSPCVNTPAAIDALFSALLSPNDICSPLFKHEVAFVFSQTLDPYSVPAAQGP